MRIFVLGVGGTGSLLARLLVRQGKPIDERDSCKSCACRQCCDLPYASQRRGGKSQRYLQALKLRLRLGGVASILEPSPDRARGMHKRTYGRLRYRGEQLERGLRQVDLRGARSTIPFWFADDLET